MCVCQVTQFGVKAKNLRRCYSALIFLEYIYLGHPERQDSNPVKPPFGAVLVVMNKANVLHILVESHPNPSSSFFWSSSSSPFTFLRLIQIIPALTNPLLPRLLLGF